MCISRCSNAAIFFLSNILFTPFGFMCSCMLKKKKKWDVKKYHLDTFVPMLKQDQPWRSDASLSQQLACPRFYLRIRSSPLYLTADVGRPLLLHDGSCRPLEAERCCFEYWWYSFLLFTKNKTKTCFCFVISWQSPRSPHPRWRGASTLPGTFTNTATATRYHNIRAQRNDNKIVLVKMPCVQKCVCTIPELQEVPTTQRVSQPTLLPEQNPSDTWRWVHTLFLAHTHLHTLPVGVDWRRAVFFAHWCVWG